MRIGFRATLFLAGSTSKEVLARRFRQVDGRQLYVCSCLEGAAVPFRPGAEVAAHRLSDSTNVPLRIREIWWQTGGPSPRRRRNWVAHQPRARQGATHQPRPTQYRQMMNVAVATPDSGVRLGNTLGRGRERRSPNWSFRPLHCRSLQAASAKA